MSQPSFSFFSGVLLCAIFCIRLCSAAEIPISPGNDSWDNARKNWKSGDVMVFAPGEYRGEFNIESDGELVLKAAIPGTAVLRGDVDAPEFTPAALPGIWQCPFPRFPETINERDTLTILHYVPTLAQLQREVGAWSYDEETQIIYVRTSDYQDPAKHYLTIGLTPFSGISIIPLDGIRGVRDVSIDGLVFSGFFSRCVREFWPPSQWNVCWGAVISSPVENVRIANSTAFLNSYGLALGGKVFNSLIENCCAWGNSNPFSYSGGGIGMNIGFPGAKNSSIRNCTAANNHLNDIWIYGGKCENVQFVGNRCYQTLRTKAKLDQNSVIRSCILGNATFIRGPEYMQNTVVYFQMPTPAEYGKNNLLFGNWRDIVPAAVLADPVNFDCRPQADAPEKIKRGAPTSESALLFFVQSDSAGVTGRSVKDALGSMQAVADKMTDGAEFYFLDRLNGDLLLKDRRNIALRGRGEFPIELAGKIVLENCDNVSLERLAPQSISLVGGKDIRIKQCVAALTASQVMNLDLRHSWMESAQINACENALVTANVFGSKQQSGGYSGYNAFAEQIPAAEQHSFVARPEPGAHYTFQNAYRFAGRAADGLPVGPFRYQSSETEFQLQKVETTALSPNTARVTLAANMPFSGSISCDGQSNRFEAAAFHSISLHNLKPDTAYEFDVSATAAIKKAFSNQTRKSRSRNIALKKQKFRTLAEFSSAREYFVAMSGDDNASGEKATPFRSILRGLQSLRPGDTLTLRAGTYSEQIDVISSGSPGRIITIRGAEGETVWITGGVGSYVHSAFLLENQHYLHFDNLHLGGQVIRPQDGIRQYGFKVNNCSNLRFTRLLLGGTGVWTMLAQNSPNIVMENCTRFGGHEALRFQNCPDLSIRNCTFVLGFVGNVTVLNTRGEKVLFENNILTDNLNLKGFLPLLYVHDIDQLTERNNLFFLRSPASEKPVLGFDKAQGEMIAAPQEYLGRRALPYQQYSAELGRPTSALFVNPDMPLLPQFELSYNSFEEQLAGLKVAAKTEFKNRENLTFTDFFARHPEVLKRGIGLVPAAFTAP